MIFQKLEFDGVHVIELEKIVDQRGFFARSWDKDVFQQKSADHNNDHKEQRLHFAFRIYFYGNEVIDGIFNIVSQLGDSFIRRFCRDGFRSFEKHF